METSNVGESIFLWKDGLGPHGQKCTLILHTCQGACGACQHLFRITFKAVAIIFLAVIFNFSKTDQFSQVFLWFTSFHISPKSWKSWNLSAERNIKKMRKIAKNWFSSIFLFPGYPPFSALSLTVRQDWPGQWPFSSSEKSSILERRVPFKKSHGSSISVFAWIYIIFLWRTNEPNDNLKASVFFPLMMFWIER